MAEVVEAVDTCRDGAVAMPDSLGLLVRDVKLGVVDVNVAAEACWSPKGSEPELDSLRRPGTTLPLVSCV